MQHTGTINIQTDRLVLRQITIDDAQDLQTILSNEQVQEYLSGIPANYTLEMAIDYIQNKLSRKYQNPEYYDWGIADRETNRLLGRITVYRQDNYRRMADLIWYIHPDGRGRGLMTEAGRAVIAHLQSLGFVRIEAYARQDNAASINVMRKLGMQYEGTLRRYDYNRDDTLYDADMYSIINE